MDTGTKVYRNYFGIKFGWQAAIRYGEVYPCFRKMMYPGDVFKIHADLLIRYQPMLAPPMNDATATVRFAFVPLRLIEEYTELIMTGSKDGKLYSDTLPVMDSVFKYLDVTEHTTVEKNSILDLLYGIPAGITLNTSGLLAKLDADKASPAAYIAKAVLRFWWDYYRDENLFSENDFETYWQGFRKYLHVANYLPDVCLKKDRLTSATPWQLKAVAAPTIEVTTTGVLSPNYTGDIFGVHNGVGGPTFQVGFPAVESDDILRGYTESSEAGQQLIQAVGQANTKFKNYLNQDQNFTSSGVGFNAAMVRELMAQTRIYERLARTGSRFTEYLRANFGVSPSDGTLQRAQYLGGFKTHIVTTEVVQTAAATNEQGNATPVGTLRGHGITHGTSTIKTFMANEPGVVIGLLDVRPETIYAQGVDRELTYRSRFDFLNPSFQHLSEQEVRKGEIYFDTDVDSNGNLKNSETWGFQPYAQELRSGIKHVAGEMRDSLSFWNQSIILSSRPLLNYAFVEAASHIASYNRPFAVNSVSALPMVVDFGGLIEAYRPLVKNGTPGLMDHN